MAFATLGCRLNQVDTEEMKGRLEADGFRMASAGEEPDVVVVNTCTVTSRADVSDRQAIRRLARAHPGARLVVTGCWAQTDPDAAAAVPGVHLVVGNADKHRLGDLLRAPASALPRLRVSPLADARMAPPAPRPAASTRSRAFLKVQEGCQHRCAFCIVPRARGRSRSQEPKVILDQVRLLVEAGHPEVVLTGVDMGHYGADLVPRTTLAALLREMVEIPGLRWVRLSSLLPAYFTPELIDVVTSSPVVAPHVHVPLQSGSDAILRRMRRPYTAAMYRRMVERLLALRPGMGLGTDLIAGHPGEQEADFEETVALVKALPFSYLHVFPYSDRSGTEAARLDGHVDPRTVARRSRRLRELGQDKNRSFRRAMVGAAVEVLVLETRDRATGRLVGLAGNYVEVQFPGPDALMRSMQTVRVTDAGDDGTLGQLA